jgi:16S rRNA (cytidine1402-2'-O)-methyltransferase
VAVLYIIGTPIGNLGDITSRAVEILKKVDLIACEDTRQSLKLLNHLGIHMSLLSCRAQNEERAAHRIIAALEEGRDVAYLSDAGTPAMSDPGALLVRRVVEAGQQVLPIPGPSAFTALVSVAGGLDKSILFEGFLSPKAGRRRSRLRELLDLHIAFVVYESPFRILKLLEDLADCKDERFICVAREISKVHEEYLRGSINEVKMILEDSAEKTEIRGEFSVYVSGKAPCPGVNGG